MKKLFVITSNVQEWLIYIVGHGFGYHIHPKKGAVMIKDPGPDLNPSPSPCNGNSFCIVAIRLGVWIRVGARQCKQATKRQFLVGCNLPVNDALRLRGSPR